MAAAGLSGVEASVLHNAWLDYEDGWLPTSRGSTPDDIAAARDSLASRGLDGDAGRALRQRIEDDTDQLTALPWELYGLDRTIALAAALEPPCELLLQRVDVTAGPNYQPASRIRLG